MDRAKSDMNLSQLTEDERQAILRVLKRDQALRNMEEKRLVYLKSELHMLKKRGALKPGIENASSRCARCLTPFGLLINTGADCFVCLKKVCRSCRQYNELAPTNTNPKQWACLVCSKQMELKAASGEWMEEYKNKSFPEGERRRSIDVVKQLVLSGSSKNEDKRRDGTGSFSNQAHVSPNISVRSAPDSRSRMESPKFERRVQFLPGSQETSIMVKKSPGTKLASPPVLKKHPLLRNSALDLSPTNEIPDSSLSSKTSKVHPEAQDRERLPVSPIYYNKCRSRRDSSSSVSTCSLSSSSVQGPSPVALRKNAHESPLDIELRNKRIAEENSPRSSPHYYQRMTSEPSYGVNFNYKSNDSPSVKSRSLGSYEESLHSPRILQPRSNNLTLGSAENLSDTTSNTPSEQSGPPSTYHSRPSSISPATFRRVLVSTYKDSSSSQSESEVEQSSQPPSQVQFRKVSLKKISLTQEGELTFFFYSCLDLGWD